MRALALDSGGSARLETLVADNVWITAPSAETAAGSDATRMTVVRLAKGGLWVHSPIDADAALRREIDRLGEVSFVVAPSHTHSRFARAFCARYPAAELFVSPRSPERHGALAYGTLLRDRPPPLWAGEIDQALIGGHRTLDEVVFFHLASRTLIVADLLRGRSASRSILCALGRALFRRGAGPVTPLGFADEGSARASLRRVLRWDFDRVVLADGGAITGGGKELLRLAYRTLLGPSVSE